MCIIKHFQQSEVTIVRLRTAKYPSSSPPLMQCLALYAKVPWDSKIHPQYNGNVIRDLNDIRYNNGNQFGAIHML